MNSFYIEFPEYRLFATHQLTACDEKPTLVFLHDSWGCTEMWGNFPESLQSLTQSDLLVYDRRGYGKSLPFDIKQRTACYLHDEADNLIEVLDKCKVKDVVLYGHSDGATIALLAAALYPERIKGLMLEGPHSFIEESGKSAVRTTRERAKTSGLLASLEKFHGNKTTELFRLWHETWLSDYFASWSIVPLLKQISCPVLAFQGDGDEFGSFEQLNVLKQEINTLVIVTEIPNAAHTPRREAEAETMKWIRAFCKNTYRL